MSSVLWYFTFDKGTKIERQLWSQKRYKLSIEHQAQHVRKYYSCVRKYLIERVELGLKSSKASISWTLQSSGSTSPIQLSRIESHNWNFESHRYSWLKPGDHHYHFPFSFCTNVAENSVKKPGFWSRTGCYCSFWSRYCDNLKLASGDQMFSWI